MDKDRELLLMIKDAIGACRLNPATGHEFTLKMPEDQGGGMFIIRIQNKNQTNGSQAMAKKIKLLDGYLQNLKISEEEFALALGVSVRSVYRWQRDIPNPVLRLLEAWIKLKEVGLSFLPNSTEIEIGRSGKVYMPKREEIHFRIHGVYP